MSLKPFSMETVLKFRKRQENLAQQKFMQALERQQQLEAQLTSMKNKQEEIIQLLSQKQMDGILAMELSRFENQIAHSYEQIDAMQQSLHERKKSTEKKRTLLVQKSQEYNMLQTLKEKQNRAWKKHIEKKEAAMLDEIAILHHDRNAH